MSGAFTIQSDLQKRLKVSEIFYSLQGESNTVGIPTVFIRLTGCPLRCQYCDTAYAFTGGEWQTLNEISKKLHAFQSKYITVTGGEPLAQKACLDLLRFLCDQGYHVSLETSGAIDISAVDPRVIKVMDLKTPGSGENEKNYYDNIRYLTGKDQVKFVICDQADYEWSKAQIEKWQLVGKCQLLFSPSYTQLQAPQLADWILADHLPVRFQIQLHKYLWGDVPGH